MSSSCEVLTCHALRRRVLRWRTVHVTFLRTRVWATAAAEIMCNGAVQSWFRRILYRCDHFLRHTTCIYIPDVLPCLYLVDILHIRLKYADVLQLRSCRTRVNERRFVFNYSCIRFGLRSKNTCANVVAAGVNVDWVTSTRYLGVYFESSVRFKCSI